MTFTFTKQPLGNGQYEPEGIYLATPFVERGRIIQFWGQYPEFYADFTYNGIPLQGYIGLCFELPLNTEILAADHGRITEISYEAQGFGRYIKLEHRWGESIYAFLQRIQVEAGQVVQSETPIATSGRGERVTSPLFHFGIRIAPYNRFDGWGGFTDPLPFLDPEGLIFPEDDDFDPYHHEPLPLAKEVATMHRP